MSLGVEIDVEAFFFELVDDRVLVEGQDVFLDDLGPKGKVFPEELLEGVVLVLEDGDEDVE